MTPPCLKTSYQLLGKLLYTDANTSKLGDGIYLFFTQAA